MHSKCGEGLGSRAGGGGGWGGGGTGIVIVSPVQQRERTESWEGCEAAHAL